MPHSVRSFSQDRTVVDHRLRSDTLRRIAAFAKPYRGAIALFLALIVVDTIAGAATPLIFKAIIDQGIEQGRTGLVVRPRRPRCRPRRALRRQRPRPALVLGPHR